MLSSFELEKKFYNLTACDLRLYLFLVLYQHVICDCILSWSPYCTSMHLHFVHCELFYVEYWNTMIPILSGHSKIDKTKGLRPCGSLMHIKNTAEFCNTFDMHYAIIGLENLFLSSFRVVAYDGFYCINKRCNKQIIVH